MAAQSLTFYFAPGSSSMAPHIALHEVGVEFQSRPVSMARKETRSEAFLAINPAGLVPVLVIDGRPLTEVAAILFYLARRFPAAKLWPDDLEQQAHVVSWMSFVASTLHVAWGALGQAADDSSQARARERLWRAFALADKQLIGRTWAVDDFSIADIHLFRLYFRLRHTLQPSKEEFPRLAEHYDRMLERPAVRRTCEIEASIGYEIRGFTPPDWLNTSVTPS